ncbi:AAA family ATPAse [Lasiodiplodia theobromae]|uniref:AAA family ATPAse n=1 Tax=Lasiodiplodia theobromae TaxID=45133 RepID=UPI0015C317E8|nr:AAA family ATPAse [Lasiodiplodia theobromae]KAF4545428.1 AAA family ATPAse [Lasiodiplodia theobromae]
MSQDPGEAPTHSPTPEYGVPTLPDVMHSGSPEEGWCEDQSSGGAPRPRPQAPVPVPVKRSASLGSKPKREGAGVKTPSSSWIVLYEIFGDLHVSPPELVATSEGESLSSSTLLKNLPKFLKENNDVMFVLHKGYSTVTRAMYLIPLDEQTRSHRADFMYITLAEPMIEAMESMVERVRSSDRTFHNIHFNEDIPHPYLPLYFLYPWLDKVIPKLDPVFVERIETLYDFLEEYQGLEYTRAREMISRGCVDHSTMPYLVHPGQVLVTRRGQDTVAFMATSSAKYNTQLPMSNARPGQQHVSGSNSNKTQTIAPKEARYCDLWQVRGWNWKFNGTFEKKSATIDIFVPVTHAEMRIADLNAHPLEFADIDRRDLLERRGRTFWKCRLRKFVSYTADEDDDFAGTSDRYMIDYRTYHRLHPESKPRAGRDDIGKAAMLDNDSPPDDTIFLFPTKLIGFNFRLKKWMQLFVDRISEPQWNKKAFESLVVEDDTKLLLEALVTEQIAAEKSTDIISGKGNGLLILLHGGPGTGKTFTAEGVAEMTEKPLYRVTCGDIGTKPDEVEKRNALVSVFLRVLEYYDAFKSRIQLALHYTNLKKSQRRKIWRNFITRLKELGETNIDYDDILDNMDELCMEEMNGRQIRNSITIARQLAQFKKEVFSYKHLKNVIGVSKRFETYLNSVNHGYTDDQLAQDAGLRFHKA